MYLLTMVYQLKKEPSFHIFCKYQTFNLPNTYVSKISIFKYKQAYMGSSKSKGTTINPVCYNFSWILENNYRSFTIFLQSIFKLVFFSLKNQKCCQLESNVSIE